jgi:threonine/homoserine/homoserine lactone efflux protein
VSVAEALGSFAILAGLLTIIPGLDTALVLRSSLTRSRTYAYATAFGICSGSFVWGAAAAVGAGALLAVSETAFSILKLVGAAYMIYLGVMMIVGSMRSRPAEVADDRAARSTWGAFGRGALTNLLNPKVGVFYMALIPQFIPDGVAPIAMGLMLALVHVVESLVWFSAIIVATQYLRRWLLSDRSRRWIDRITGGIFIGFAGFLVAETRL